MVNISHPTERLHTMREASAVLRVHPNTIRRWDKEGKIRVVRTERGHRRIPESEINRLLHQTPPIIAPTRPNATREEELSTFLNFVFSYHRDDWDLVRKAVIIRDNYACQECGSKELIEVHHKNGTSRNDPENLATLCQKCHEVHGRALPTPRVPEQRMMQEVREKPAVEEEKKPIPISPAEVEIPRHAILDALEPTGLTQRTAFGDLLSAAMMLGNFTFQDLATRAHCPEAVAITFCERMSACGYLKSENGVFKMDVKVIR